MSLKFLPDDGGLFLVTTKQSSYVVNVDQKTVCRFRGEESRHIGRHDGFPFAYRHIHCERGLEMNSYGVDGHWRRSTEVLSIHRVNEDGSIDA